MVELLIGAVLVPILTKLTEKLIERVAGELDSKLVTLIKNLSAGGDKAKKDLGEYLAKNKTEASKLAVNLRRTLKSDEAIQAIGRGAQGDRTRLQICNELANDVFEMVIGLKRPIALRGFFNDARLVSVFSADNSNVPPKAFVRGDASRGPRMELFPGSHIYLARYKHFIGFDKAVARLNANMAISRSLPEEIRKWDEVRYIYEHWLQPESLKSLDALSFVTLTEKERVKWQIRPEGVAQFVRSIAKFYADELRALAEFNIAAEATKTA